LIFNGYRIVGAENFLPLHCIIVAFYFYFGKTKIINFLPSSSFGVFWIKFGLYPKNTKRTGKYPTTTI